MEQATIFDELRAHRAKTAGHGILALLEGDPARAADFSVEACGMLFDYSKTAMDRDARAMLLALAGARGVAGRRRAMFEGARINETEGRAVLHTALRRSGGEPVLVDGTDVMPGIVRTRARMEAFAEGIRSGALRTPGGQAFTDVINIGIGGSDLGPAMANIALSPWHDGPRCHYVSNVDGAAIRDTLALCPPETTLVIVASKTFTTVETMTNAQTARDWLAAVVGKDKAAGHFCAVSSDLHRTAKWGIPAERVFGFGDYVGGRYSLWGPIGLSILIGIGRENFRAFLAGGEEMDQHFRTAEGFSNMPLMLALTGLWHNQVCGYATRAVLPYEERLARLPAYLQQLEMESNGKRVAMDGTTLAWDSGPVVWGEPGTNGQHAFYQLIHQGTRVIPCEFMVGAQGHEESLGHHHALLVANCLAQSEALMRGRSLDEARTMLAARGPGGLAGAELERQARHRVFPGNRPSTTLVYDRLDPATLGRIVALYEHRVFCEGVIIGINSFDQWGVELGKELATALLPMVETGADASAKDASTRQLLARVGRAS